MLSSSLSTKFQKMCYMAQIKTLQNQPDSYMMGTIKKLMEDRSVKDCRDLGKIVILVPMQDLLLQVCKQTTISWIHP